MLEFNIEPLSGQLVAHSDKCKFTTYWIEDSAWYYLQIHTLTHRGPVVRNRTSYTSLDDAKQEAEEFEALIGVKASEAI